jgi:glycosyltransferase involved in cell wall biosynthesis
MKVLIGCLFFREYTGSELYVYELALHLKKLKCKVAIVSADIGAEMQVKAMMHGIEVLKPHDLKGRNFDIIHCQHQPVIEMLLKVYPNTPKVCTIHSEILKYEEPIFDKSILQYIAIRPSIVDLLKFKGINEKRIKLIYNPIDSKRFKSLDPTSEQQFFEHLLFVGSADYLRKRTIEDLIHYTHKEGLGLKLIGKYKNSDLVEYSKHKHISIFTPTWNVENFVQHCKYTASILMGRTIIEGWMCGKSGWVYTIDANGHITNKELVAPPTPKELEKFHSENVAKEIYNILKKTYENPI